MRNELYNGCLDPAARRALERRAVEAVERDFLRLYNAPEDAVPAWRGSKTDLIEMAYLAYVDGLVCDADGQPLPLRQIVGAVCRRLRLSTPSNPSSLALRALRRKGVKQRSVLERYERRMGLRAGR